MPHSALRTTTTLTFTALLAWQALPAAAETPSLRDTVSSIEPATVAVLAVNDDGTANQGTGFIVRSDGLVITCAHVVNGAASIQIHWSDTLDRAAVTATVIAEDGAQDLALLQLPTGEIYATLPLAIEREVRVGDAVVALGFPVGDILGLTDLSVTRGIISAIRRNSSGEAELVQTDTPITVGNSGGPLYDLDLQAVVGVVRAKGVEELTGINFAASSSVISELFPEVSMPPSSRIAAAPVATTAPPTHLGPLATALFNPLTFGRLAGWVVEVCSWWAPAPFPSS